MKTLPTLALAGAVIFGAAGAGQAATTLTISSVGAVHAGAPTADLNMGAPWPGYLKIQNNARLTPLTVTGTLDGTAVSLFTYCVDIFQTAGTGTFKVVSLASYLNDAIKYNRLAALIDTNSTVGSKLHDAAMQLAIWELVNEIGPQLNVNSGFFVENDLSNVALKGAANGLLASAVGHAGSVSSDLQLYVAKSAGKQDLLFWSRTPAVPEPASWAMMIMGLGAVGASLRYSPRNTTLRFA